MNCNKCFHEYLCEKRSHLSDSTDQEDCCQFVNKELVLALPCKIGERVFKVKYSPFNFIKTKGYYIYDGRFFIGDVNEVGKSVFLTVEEAENRIQELIKKDNS